MDQTHSRSLRPKIEALFARQVADLTGCAEFRALEGGYLY